MTAVAVFIYDAWVCVIHGLFWDLQKPTYRRLTTAVLILAAGGVIASLWADELLWGGSLDWLSITWLVEAGERMVEGHAHPLPYVRFNRLVFDIKDVYLWLSCLLLAIRSVLVIVTYANCTPEERAGLKEKERHPIRNLRNMLAHMRAQSPK